jgi:aspartate aminotransferase
MTGWRLGWIAAPQWIATACNKLQGQYTSGPCSIAQKAAEAAYLGDLTPVIKMQEAFQRRCDLAVKLAKEIPGFKVQVPKGAFYVFPECSFYLGKTTPQGAVINTAADLAMYLLEEGHVTCVGGDAFGAPDCIRMSYAVSDEKLVEAFARIKKALANLK